MIELIVVMAILSILMTVVFAMFKPVNQFYVNVAEVDKRYSSVQGINDYLCESVKYAQSVYIFNNVNTINGKKLETNPPGSPSTYEYIYKRFMIDAGLNISDPNDQKKVKIIAIYADKIDTWNGTDYSGRIYKVNGINGTSLSVGDYFTNQYQIFGKGYYGPYNYKFTMNGAYDYDGTSVNYEADNSKFVIKTEISDISGKITDLVSNTDYINKNKSGAGSFYYFDPTTTPPTLPINVSGTLPAGNNIFIMYVMP